MQRRVRRSFARSRSGRLDRRLSNTSSRIRLLQTGWNRRRSASRSNRSRLSWPYRTLASRTATYATPKLLLRKIQFDRLAGHLTKHLPSGNTALPLVGEDIGQLDAPVGPRSIEGDVPPLQESDQVRPRHVEQVRSLLRGELGGHGHDAHPVAPQQFAGDLTQKLSQRGRQWSSLARVIRQKRDVLVSLQETLHQPPLPGRSSGRIELTGQVKLTPVPLRDDLNRYGILLLQFVRGGLLRQSEAGQTLLV